MKQLSDIEIIKQFRLIDDDFMNICFTDLPCVEFVLRIILNKPDLKVSRSQVQKFLKGPERSVWLDIYATDSDGRDYDIELQRDERGADPRRARFHSSMLDTWNLKSRQRFSKLRETWVIFITEKDVLKLGLPVYTIDRRINETGGYFGDGSHIIYVNGSIRDKNTPIGKLMHDFFCVNPDDMNYSLLAERTRYFKEDEKGVRKMSRIMREFKREIRAQAKAEGRAEGRAEGFIEGRVKTLFELVKKNLLSAADAAMSMNISEPEFLAKMNASK